MVASDSVSRRTREECGSCEAGGLISLQSSDRTMSPAERKDDLAGTQQRLEWVMPKISMLTSWSTEGKPLLVYEFQVRTDTFFRGAPGGQMGPS